MKCQSQTRRTRPHPPSLSLSLPHTLSFTMYRRAAVEECSLVLQSSAGLIFLCVFEVCESVPAHIVTVWRNEATREPFSQGDFMERLIYSAAIHTTPLVPQNRPLCLFSMSASVFISFQYLPRPLLSLSTLMPLCRG